MHTELEYKTVDMMEKYGGSFVKALAQAARHADRYNFLLIKTTFQNYWAEYEGMAEKAK